MQLTGSCHSGAIQFRLVSHTPQPYMRCYCSICRKTGGGGGYAINIMGEARNSSSRWAVGGGRLRGAGVARGWVQRFAAAPPFRPPQNSTRE